MRDICIVFSTCKQLLLPLLLNTYNKHCIICDLLDIKLKVLVKTFQHVQADPCVTAFVAFLRAAISLGNLDPAMQSEAAAAGGCPTDHDDNAKNEQWHQDPQQLQLWRLKQELQKAEVQTKELTAANERLRVRTSYILLSHPT